MVHELLLVGVDEFFAAKLTLDEVSRSRVAKAERETYDTGWLRRLDRKTVGLNGSSGPCRFGLLVFALDFCFLGDGHFGLVVVLLYGEVKPDFDIVGKRKGAWRNAARGYLLASTKAVRRPENKFKLIATRDSDQTSGNPPIWNNNLGFLVCMGS